MIYLDNAATTRPCAQAVAAVEEMLRENWGNPSSLHTLGLRAEEAVTAARRVVAQRLSCREDEVFFTSGGTEANNLAVFGAAEAGKRRGDHIVTTLLEHPSVLHAVQKLEKDGWRVTYLKPDESGNISSESVYEAVTEKTVLVTMMAVNNETGALLPVESAARAVKEKSAPALLHIDAVQAFGKLALSTAKISADLITVSSHKLHGPKGAGALFVRKSARVVQRAYGGGQEGGLRPGTEAAPLIAGFGAALRVLPEQRAAWEKVSALNVWCKENLAALAGVKINSPQTASPYILNFSCGPVRAETMLHFLAARGVYVSSGSACAKGQKSPVLTAMGLSKERIEAALRVSFCAENTLEDAQALVLYVQEGLAALAHR